MTTDPQTPHSEQDAYHRALYLHSMIKAAAHILDTLQGIPELRDTGVRDLVNIIEERADALSLALDG